MEPADDLVRRRLDDRTGLDRLAALGRLPSFPQPGEAEGRLVPVDGSGNARENPNGV